MTQLLLLLFMVLVAPRCWSVEEAGRQLNFHTLDVPNYIEARLPTDDEQTGSKIFRLPEVNVEDAGPGPGLSLRAQPRVFVSEIRVEGAHMLPPETVAALAEPYVNRLVTMEGLHALRLKLSSAYLSAGYINSGVVIPDQRVENGVVVLRAIEGNLSRIVVEGRSRLRPHYVRSRILTKVEGPLNIVEIQRALERLQRDPHIDRLDARLGPGDALGESVLRIRLEEPKRFEVGLAADNHRPTSVGSERGRVWLRSRNVTGFGELLEISGTASKGSSDGSARLVIPVNRWDTTAEIYYSESTSDLIERAFEELDIESQTQTWGGIISHPAFDSAGNSLVASIGFESKESESKLLGEPFSFSPGAVDGKANTNVALLGLDWTNRGSHRVLGLRATWRKGLDVSDATIFDPDMPSDPFNSNPTGADGVFDVALLQGLYMHRLNRSPWLSKIHDRGQMVVRTTAQLAFDPLMSLEKLAVGGVNTVRGYPENLLVRDNGVAASIEIQVPIPNFRSSPHPLNLVIAPFIDYGISWDESDTDTTSAVRDTSDKRSISAAGLGIIWQPIRGLHAQVYWASEIHDNFDQDDPRGSTDGSKLQDKGIHFALSYSMSF